MSVVSLSLAILIAIIFVICAGYVIVQYVRADPVLLAR
jgi:hypothetical protein